MDVSNRIDGSIGVEDSIGIGGSTGRSVNLKSAQMEKILTVCKISSAASSIPNNPSATSTYLRVGIQTAESAAIIPSTYNRKMHPA